MNAAVGRVGLDVHAIILAGGTGTRLGASSPIPKPMVEIGGRPVLEHTVRICRAQGVRRFLFKTGHLSSVIEAHFGDGTREGCVFEYRVERELVGTAGGLAELAGSPHRHLVLYGDVLFNLSLAPLLAFHRRTGAQATLVVHESDHPEDSDVVQTGPDGAVTAIVHKPGTRALGTRTNAGVYILEPECFSLIPAEGACDFGRDVLPAMLRARLRVFAFETTQYLKDMGTPTRLHEVSRDVALGRALNRVDGVILDRDGTINEEVDLLRRVEDFRLLPGATRAIAALNEANIPVVVATNQPVVARNLCDEATVQAVHDRMTAELEEGGAFVTAIYYCPHHPETHHAEGNPAYRIDCSCRKPKPGMLLQAARDLGLRLERCFMIGDSDRDVGAGAAAGARTILLRPPGGAPEPTPRAEYVFEDVAAAATFVLKLNRSTIDAVVAETARQRERRPIAVVAIGGCAQVGKTTLARDLQERLAPLRSEVIALDGFLLDVAARKPGSRVSERYDYAAISATLGSYLGGDTVTIHEYDRRHRRPGAARTVASDGIDVLIVEGVVALDVPALALRADVTVFKDERDDVRRARVAALLARERDLARDEIARIVAAREEEEVPYIKATASRATYVL
jgi:histidinol-phosphate phosphatase family protein